jgi:hypothetical protein
MDTLIGILLLLVFFAFALAMFLERISALLALPLMATSFLLISAIADIAQPDAVASSTPPQASAFEGHLDVTLTEQSRFARWQTARRTQLILLHQKSLLLAETAKSFQAALQSSNGQWPADLQAELAVASERQAAFDSRAAATLDEMYAPFHRPGALGGARENTRDELSRILIVELFSPAMDRIDAVPTAQARAEVSALLEEISEIARAEVAAHPAPPATESTFFTLQCAAGYLLNHVILMFRAGSLALATAIIATIFGGMFAVYVRNLKIAERMVYWTAEYAGENPFLVALAVFAVTAVVFTSIGGLGTVIMLGAIILPILRSIGLTPIVAAGTFLIAISLGGTLQPVARRLWIDYYGIAPRVLDSILWTLVSLYAATGVIWIFLGTRKRLLSSFCAEERPREKHSNGMPARLILAPAIPVVLVYFAGVEEITAFTLTIAYMFVCVCRRAGAARELVRSLIEGAQTVMPPVLLMLGIGILLVSLTTDAVQGYLRPLLAQVTPATRAGYIAGFALAAPLALYRGPLNVWGMGLAVSSILLTTSPLPPAAILCAILAVNMLQGVCDPTNTANVWIAGYLGITANQILRHTIVLVWAAAIAAVIIFGMRFVPVTAT